MGFSYLNFKVDPKKLTKVVTVSVTLINYIVITFSGHYCFWYFLV